jgi:hypothetical protein
MPFWVNASRRLVEEASTGWIKDGLVVPGTAGSRRIWLMDWPSTVVLVSG